MGRLRIDNETLNLSAISVVVVYFSHDERYSELTFRSTCVYFQRNDGAATSLRHENPISRDQTSHVTNHGFAKVQTTSDLMTVAHLNTLTGKGTSDFLFKRRRQRIRREEGAKPSDLPISVHRTLFLFSGFMDRC